MANSCTFKQGRQYFRYSFITKQIHSGRQQAKNCLDIDLRMKELFIAECSIEKNTQKWNWGMIDVQMLTNWKNSGKPIIDEIEMEEE